MTASLDSATLVGVGAQIIRIEVDSRYGLAGMTILGLPAREVQEAKLRVITAIRNSGLEFTYLQTVINLLPVNLPKRGTQLDLPIAIAYLVSTQQIPIHNDWFVVGSLALSGQVMPIQGILPMLIEAGRMGYKQAIIPVANLEEARLVPNMTLYPITNLIQATQVYSGSSTVEPVYTSNAHFKQLSTEGKAQTGEHPFNKIRGQLFAKRAAEVAVAGRHNILFCGPAGCGKTLIANGMRSMLPPLNQRKALESLAIYSSIGQVSLPLSPPFRTPHHSISTAAMAGGGATFQPGEITLAHNGVLMLDELLEFNQVTLESLRQPMENRRINVSRVTYKFDLPCDFQLIATTNLCRCGKYGLTGEMCSCTAQERRVYQSKLSGAIMDRFDMVVRMGREDASSPSKPYQPIGFINRQQTTPRDTDPDAVELLRRAANAVGLSVRAEQRVLNVANTLAAIEGSERVGRRHVLESLSYKPTIL